MPTTRRLSLVLLAVDDGTFVGYRVQEELAGIGTTTATGRTPAVEGTMTIEDSTVTAVEIDAVGEFTLHGVTRTVTWPLQAQLVDQTIVVVGSLDIAMADHDITPPSAQRVLAIDDAGVAELRCDSPGTDEVAGPAS